MSRQFYVLTRLTITKAICAIVLAVTFTIGSASYLGLTTAPAIAQTTPLQQIAGIYLAQGKNPDGTTYSGRVTITVQNEIAYFNWEIAGQTYSGQGPMVGDTLVIDWGDTTPVVYQVSPDGILRGTWSGGTASETLRRIQ